MGSVNKLLPTTKLQTSTTIDNTKNQLSNERKSRPTADLQTKTTQQLTPQDQAFVTAHSHDIQILESLSDIKGKVNTNDLAIRAGSKLRVIAIKDSTYNDLREFAFNYKNHSTYDEIIRKLFDAYNNKK